MCFDLIPGFLSTGVKQDLWRCTDRSFPFLCCLAHLTSQKALSSNMTPEFQDEYRRAKRTRMTAFSFFYLTFGVLSTIREGYHRKGVAAGHSGWESVSKEWGWQVLGCGHSLCGPGAQRLGRGRKLSCRAFPSGKVAYVFEAATAIFHAFHGVSDH